MILVNLKGILIEVCFKKKELIDYEINGIKKKGKIIGIDDHERFQILNHEGVRDTPKIKDVKITY